MSKFYGAFHLLPMTTFGNEIAFKDLSVRFHVVAFILGSFRIFFYLVLVKYVVDKTNMGAK